MIRDNLRVMHRAALVALADLRAIYTWKTWTFAWLSRILFQVAFFALIGKMLGSHAETRYLLVGNSVFVVTMVTVFVCVSAAWERQSGTLPLLMASPTRPFVVFAGRGANWLLDGTICAAVSLLVIGPVFGVALPWPRTIFVLPLVVSAGLSTYCFALVLSGAVLRWPQSRNLLANLAYLSMMILCGVQVPVTFLPQPLRYAADGLPLTHSLAAIRALLSDAPPGSIVLQAALEAAVSLGWLIAAFATFRQLVKSGREDGSIEFGTLPVMGSLERRLFGTDGVRAVANAVLTPDLMLGLGRALGVTLADETCRPQVVVGRDPRPSSEFLEAAFAAGLASAGADVIAVGMLPTAAIAFLTPHFRAAAGAVITASHNPLEDNGLKLFDPEGYKYSEVDETKIEQLVSTASTLRSTLTGTAVGRIRDRSNSARDAYIEHLVAGMPHLDGIRITVDCANGASAVIAPWVYRLAGAEVLEIASDQSGNKINNGVGATNPEYLQQSLTNGISRIGFAHDGDADRIISVDELGQLVDGADIMAIFAIDAHSRNSLRGSGLVTTPMTNSGLARSLRTRGIGVFESAIGDRPVLRMMRERGYELGGEQTGHVITLKRATTGDGILTGLMLLEIMHRTGNELHKLTKVWHRSPQRLINIPTPDRTILDRTPELSRLLEREREILQRDGGRLIVRLSTIENVVRVVCEAHDQAIADSVAERIAIQLKDSISRRNQRRDEP